MAPKRRYEAPPPLPPSEGRVEGRITIVQEDRFRVVDPDGRGYLFTAGKGVASLDQLERWRDEGRRIQVAYEGVPDLGAVATRVRATGR